MMLSALSVPLITGSPALSSNTGVVNRPGLKSPKDGSSGVRLCQPLDVSKTPPAEGFKALLWSLGLETAGYTDSDSDCQAFDQVSPEKFKALELAVDERAFPLGTPRLSYNPQNGRLIVEMPLAAHEFILSDFRRFVQPALDRLSLHRRWFRASLEGNLSMRSPRTGFSTTADLALVAETMGNSPLSDLFCIVECAFSQDHSELMEKVKSEIEGWPGVAFVIVILVSEAQDYHSPQKDTPTWTFFSQQDDCLAADDFLRLPSTVDECLSRPQADHSSPPPPTSAELRELSNGSNSEDSVPLELDPIKIAGHTWCHITNVEYRIWVRQDGEDKIDVDRDEFTSGSLYPTIKMEGVERMIHSGLSAMKQQIAQRLEDQGSPLDAHRLRQAMVAAQFDWPDMQTGLKFAAWRTSTHRYDTWYYDHFRGVKRPHPDEEEYQPARSSTTNCRSADLGGVQD